MDIVNTVVTHADMLSAYYLSNEDRFKRWHPRVKPGHHSVDAWRLRLIDRERDFREGRAAHFIGVEDDHVVGACSLTSIVYHPGCFAYMGYSVDAEYEGRGYMTAIVQHVIDYAFNELRLNRISANYIPTNHRSARLLAKLGFEKEGYAKRYLNIDGRWEDHVLTSLLNPASGATKGHV